MQSCRISVLGFAGAGWACPPAPSPREPSAAAATGPFRCSSAGVLAGLAFAFGATWMPRRVALSFFFCWRARRAGFRLRRDLDAAACGSLVLLLLACSPGWLSPSARPGCRGVWLSRSSFAGVLAGLAFAFGAPWMPRRVALSFFFCWRARRAGFRLRRDLGRRLATSPQDPSGPGGVLTPANDPGAAGELAPPEWSGSAAAAAGRSPVRCGGRCGWALRVGDTGGRRWADVARDAGTEILQSLQDFVLGRLSMCRRNPAVVAGFRFAGRPAGRRHPPSASTVGIHRRHPPSASTVGIRTWDSVWLALACR
jgi:hypothetical protein